MLNKYENAKWINNNQNSHYMALHDRKIYQKAFIQWINDNSLDAYITLNFNCDITLDIAKNKLAHFFAKLDRKLIGPKWKEKPEDRTLMIVLPENIDSNFHYHALGTLSPKAYGMSEDDIEDLISDIWETVLPAGSTHFAFNTYNQKVIPDYISKQLIRHGRIEQFILSNEFWPKG